jgi:RNA-binding protein
MTPLTGKQRGTLRGLAHHLDPIVHLGRQGLTDAVAEAVNVALESHELIKVKVMEACPMKRAEAATALAESMNAHVAGGVGRVAILYRKHPTEPKIKL